MRLLVHSFTGGLPHLPERRKVIHQVKIHSRHVAGSFALLGIALLLVGIFLPLYVRFGQSNCLSGLPCSSDTLGPSLWESYTQNLASSDAWIERVGILVAAAVFIVLQLVVALGALFDRPSRVVFVLRLLCIGVLVVVGAPFFVLAAMGLYSAVNDVCCRSGSSTAWGELAAGFWFFCVGCLLCLWSDLALFRRPRV